MCSIEGCDSSSRLTRGWCQKHYQRWKKWGDPTFRKQCSRMDATHRVMDREYVRILTPDHPSKAKGGYILEHRLVMEEKLSRYLRPDENVHHINGDKSDNRPENLELWSISQPPGQRVADKVAWAKELLALYEPEALATNNDALTGQLAP